MPLRYALDGARSDLTDPAEITALMAQDLTDLHRQSGGVTRDQLLARGWSSRQISRFFQRTPEAAFEIWARTSATPHEAAPFLKFDADMRRRRDRATPAGARLAAQLRRFFDPMMIWVTLCFVTGVAMIFRSLTVMMGGAL